MLPIFYRCHSRQSLNLESGDFLKLSPVGGYQIQEGFSVVLDTYSPEQGMLSVLPLSQKIRVSKNQLYALDEEATDWNAPKISRVLNLLKDPKFRPEVIQMLLGHVKGFASDSIAWIEQWYQSRALACRIESYPKKSFILALSGKSGIN